MGGVTGGGVCCELVVEELCELLDVLLEVLLVVLLDVPEAVVVVVVVVTSPPRQADSTGTSKSTVKSKIISRFMFDIPLKNVNCVGNGKNTIFLFPNARNANKNRAYKLILPQSFPVVNEIPPKSMNNMKK